MRTFGNFIRDISPKFNLQLVEGLSYHRLLNAVEYIDRFIVYSCKQKTDTHLKYLGFKELTPKEEMKALFSKTGRVVHDVAENDIYLVEFYFQYGDNPDILTYPFYLPFLNKGNVIHLSGGKHLVMPTLADKVISVGQKIIFINILTAKYSFSRTYTGARVNGRLQRVPVINTELYRNQSKKLEDTTKARTTVMHYMLANYGYTVTMQMLLGFVPKPVYDVVPKGHTVISTTGEPPHGYIKSKTIYPATKIQFVIPDDKYSENVLYCVGNIFYILDNFPENVSIDELDNTVMWKRLLAEIIHSGNHGLSYLREKIDAHFSDLNSSFDAITISKLRDGGVQSSSLIELMVVIFQNFNNWIMRAESRSLYHVKSLEVESFVLAPITSRITRAVLDISKEELRIGGQQLEMKAVTKILDKYMKPRAIFSLRKGNPFVTSVEDAGDHLYPKKTAMLVLQESDFANTADDPNTSERQPLVATASTVGSILNLSKNNPTPLLRANPYARVHPVTGTILPHEDLMEIIERTDAKLANTSMVEADMDRLEGVLADPEYDMQMDDESDDPDEDFDSVEVD